MTKQLCDFCSDPLRSVFWEHPCEDFTAEILMVVRDMPVHQTQEVYGSWMACIPCHLMLDDVITMEVAGKDTTQMVNQMALRSRARWLRRLVADSPDYPSAGQQDAYLAAAVETINMYLQHRTGQPIRHG